MAKVKPSDKTLRPVQVKSLKQLIKSTGNVFLCDQPGDGKTVTTLAYLNYLKTTKVLIVCKTSGVTVWRKHIEDWLLQKANVFEYHPSEYGVILADILIVNYHWLSYKQCASEIVNHFPYDICILDEPHIIRTAKSDRAKNLFSKNGLCNKAKKTIAITGTLLFNKPIGLYPLLRGLVPQTIKGYNRHDYGMKFCNGRWDSQQEQYVFDGASNVPELRNLLRGVVIENSEHVERSNLAQPEIIYIPKDKTTKKILKQFDESFKPAKYSKHRDDEVDDDIEVATLRRELGERKIGPSVDIIKKQILKYEKVLVFAYHRGVVAELHNQLKPFVDTHKLVGGMSKKKVNETINWFQALNGPACLVASVTAFNDTITLTATRRPIFVEVSYIWNENFQAIMRTRPLQQKKIVRPLFIMFKDSFDERILEINYTNTKVQKEFKK